MTVKEVAKLTGVSVRTLHHYDEIGLLRPQRNTENSYRTYGSAELDLLQQILLFRECGFPLSAIRKMLTDPGYNREEAISLQKKYLHHEKRRIQTMIQTLEKTMQALKGEIQMNESEKFKGFDLSHNPYEKEARERWGDKTVEASQEKLASLSAGEKSSLENKMNTLFAELSELRGEDPGSKAAQQGVQRLYNLFTKDMSIPYTPKAFAGVGMLYVQDDRFTENIDQFGTGLASFLSRAIQIFAQRL